jgi:hypothetical protein
VSSACTPIRGWARPIAAKTDLCASQTGLGADGAQCSLACTQLPQRLSTRVRGSVSLVAGKLIYTAWGPNSPSAAGIFGDFRRRETGPAQHTREQSVAAVVKGIVR